MSRKSTSMTLDATVLDEARGLGINLSKAAEAGLRDAIKAERERAWKAENADAIDAMNLLIERDGLPLARHRPF